jgi:small GTP-binding protein
MGAEEDIRQLEDEIKKTKYNKATQYHVGLLKAKLARLKDKQEASGSKKAGFSYSVRKTGDATILLVGFPSVGKSTLLNKITSASSKVGDYDFTTLDVIPGMMEYNSSHIQILDIPGVVTGASSGRGRGKEILSVIRNADLIIIMIDRLEQLPVIERELYDSGFRLNAKRPEVLIKKTERGGIKISGVRFRHIDGKMVKIVMNERGMHNADVIIREDVTLERLIDATCGNRVYVKAIVVFNKIDTLSEDKRKTLSKDFVQVSSLEGEGIEELKKMIWDKLDLMRIYMKRVGKQPDMNKPLIVKKGSTVLDIAERIHKEFARNLEYARIWGASAKFPEQKVGVKHILRDGDIVELHMQ